MNRVAAAAILMGLTTGAFNWEPAADLPPPRPDEYWMALAGDSSITGAAAHPDLQASVNSLAGRMLAIGLWHPHHQKLPIRIEDYQDPSEFGITAPVAAPTRLRSSPADINFRREHGFTAQIFAEGNGAFALDSEEYSFGYMAGRALGVPPRHIVILGHDGATIDTLERQFSRLRSLSPNLPPLLVISFVANDLCDPRVFHLPVEEFARSYQIQVREQLAKLSEIPPHPQGTRVVFLEPLDLANIVSNPSLASQTVSLQGREVSCGEIRKRSDGPLASVVQKILIKACPAVLEHPDEGLAQIRKLQKAQTDVLKNEEALFNTVHAPKIRLTVASSVRRIRFEAGDLANDCFHPSVRGHARIARQLLLHELRHERQPTR